SGMVEELGSILAKLRAKAELAIDAMCFINAWHSYGDYDPVENPQFRPGDRVSVYIQVRNFSTDEGGSGPAHYCTRLEGQAEIRDYAGHKIMDLPYKRDRIDQS